MSLKTTDFSGLRLIGLVLTDKSWDILKENKISDSDFFGDSSKALNFIRNYVSEHDSFPTTQFVEEETKLEFPDPLPRAATIKSFFKRRKSRFLKKLVESAADLNNKGKPDEAESYLISGLAKSSLTSELKSVKENASQRVADYKEDRLKPLQGILPPFETWRKNILMFANGTTNTILGVSSVGKCLEENTPIQCGDGITRTIKEMVESQEDIFSIDPKTKEVTQKTPANWFYSGEKDCFKVSFKSGGSITASKDHPFLGKFDWIKVGDIKEGTLIARCSKLPQPKNAKELSPTEILELTNDPKYYIRNELFTCTDECIKAFIQKELSLDYLIINFKTKEQAQFIRHCFLRLGKYYSIKKEGEYYRLILEQSTGNIFWDEVVSVKPVGIKRTYDLSVADTHSFIANYTHVHNSWICAYSAYHAAFVQNKKVLLVTKENTMKSILNRIDSMAFKLTFKDLRAKMLDARAEQRWEKEAVEILNQQGDVLVADSHSIKSVKDIYQQIVVHKPDFVVVDGAYKLASTDFADSSKLLQDFCDYANITNIPWVLSSQLKPEANSEKGVKTKGIQARGNKGWYIDVDTSLAITQTEEQALLDNVVECVVTKNRESGGSDRDIPKNFYLKMDMNLTQINEFDLEAYLDAELHNLTV